ncbi:hypothetical protein AB691_2266 [Stutzerimonas stutzeri]|nr:hypothetical protein AB691_2266 [Stutzerimonas stutzeri]
MAGAPVNRSSGPVTGCVWQKFRPLRLGARRSGRGNSCWQGLSQNQAGHIRPPTFPDLRSDPMQSAQTGNDVRTERLIEWLRDAHAMEAQAETMLNKQASRIEHYPELKARIEQHITETQNQAKLIEGCLQRYDKSYSGLKDLGGKMMAMGQAMGGMMVNDEIVKGAQMGYVFENLEIASYKILIAAAEAVGDMQTKEVCERILVEEVAMADWLRDHLAELTQAYLTARWNPTSKPSAETACLIARPPRPGLPHPLSQGRCRTANGRACPSGAVHETTTARQDPDLRRAALCYGFHRRLCVDRKRRYRWRSRPNRAAVQHRGVLPARTRLAAIRPAEGDPLPQLRPRCVSQVHGPGAGRRGPSGACAALSRVTPCARSDSFRRAACCGWRTFRCAVPEPDAPDWPRRGIGRRRCRERSVPHLAVHGRGAR